MKKFLILLTVLAFAWSGLANFRKSHNFNNGRGYRTVEGINIYLSSTASTPTFCHETCAKKMVSLGVTGHFGVVCGGNCCWATIGSRPGCNGYSCYSQWSGKANNLCSRYST